MAFAPTVPALRISRTFAAPRERVFRAWTTPEAVASWFAPTPEYATRVPALDVRPGGRYALEMELEGKIHRVEGVYREVRFPERLVFTWEWDAEPALGDTGKTLVTLEFHECEGGTELILIHESFANTDVRDQHEKGWAGCLAGLEGFLK